MHALVRADALQSLFDFGLDTQHATQHSSETTRRERRPPRLPRSRVATAGLPQNPAPRSTRPSAHPPTPHICKPPLLLPSQPIPSLTRVSSTEGQGVRQRRQPRATRSQRLTARTSSYKPPTHITASSLRAASHPSLVPPPLPLPPSCCLLYGPRGVKAVRGKGQRTIVTVWR
jgi:hypothetical protein